MQIEIKIDSSCKETKVIVVMDILRQTVTHLLIGSLCTFPMAYFMRWMDHSVFGILSYFGIFFGIYFLIWVSQYMAVKKRIQQINRKVQKNNHMDSI